MQKSVHVALVGPANAGKSSLVNTLVGLRVSAESHRMNTTVEQAPEAIRTVGDTQAVLLDGPGWTPGRPPRLLHGGRAQSHRAVSGASGADVVVLVLDGTRRIRAGEWAGMVPVLRVARSLLRENSGGTRLAEDGTYRPAPRVILAVNKVDALGKGAAREARERQALSYFAEGWEGAAVAAGLPGADGHGVGLEDIWGGHRHRDDAGEDLSAGGGEIDGVDSDFDFWDGDAPRSKSADQQVNTAAGAGAGASSSSSSSGMGMGRGRGGYQLVDVEDATSFNYRGGHRQGEADRTHSRRHGLPPHV